MSTLTDVAFRTLALTGVVLLLLAAFLSIGAHLQVTEAEAAPTNDAGVRLVVVEPTPRTLPASLLKGSTR